MTDQHHSHDPSSFDPDDPLTMMGVAMVGMTLQEMAEEEERQAADDSAPSQPTSTGSSRSDLSSMMPLVVIIIVAVGVMLLCGLLASTSGL